MLGEKIKEDWTTRALQVGASKESHERVSHPEQEDGTPSSLKMRGGEPSNRFTVGPSGYKRYCKERGEGGGTGCSSSGPIFQTLGVSQLQEGVLPQRGAGRKGEGEDTVTTHKRLPRGRGKGLQGR